MFYTVGKKIYRADFDQAKGHYPEVALKVNEEGVVYPEVLETGSKERPKKCKLCCLREIIAQYGADATASVTKAE